MITDAYAIRKQQEVMQDTWGHLAPKKGRSYKGWMIWAYGGYGDIILLDADFKKLSDSPWLYEQMQEYISENLNGEGIYKWEGQVSKIDEGCYCFGGEIKRIDIKDIFTVKEQKP